jgi:hypothetical protein
MTMMRYGTILIATAILLTPGVAQQVLGNNKGKVRAVNALAPIGATEKANCSGADAISQTVPLSRFLGSGLPTRFKMTCLTTRTALG